jgi:hypothetical protein
VFIDCRHDVPVFLGFISDVLEILGVVSNKLPRTRSRCAIAIESIETPAVRSDPEHAGRVLEEGPDPVVTQAVRIVRVVLVHCETVPVILVESVVGAKPHEALAILEDAVHGTVRESVFNRDALETEAVF